MSSYVILLSCHPVGTYFGPQVPISRMPAVPTAVLPTYQLGVLAKKLVSKHALRAKCAHQESHTVFISRETCEM